MLVPSDSPPSPQLSTAMRNPRMLPHSEPSLIAAAGGRTRFEMELSERAWNTQRSHAAEDKRGDKADLHPAWCSRPMWKKPIGRTYRAPDRAPEHALPANLRTSPEQNGREQRTRILIEHGYIRMERNDWAPSQLPEPWC